MDKESIKIVEYEKKIMSIKEEIEELEQPFVDIGERLKEARKKLRYYKGKLKKLSPHLEM